MTNKHWKEKLYETCGEIGGAHPTYLLFDDAQDTYCDLELWNAFFKNVTSMANIYVALFCSYGSASPRLVDESYGTSDHFDEYHRLSLLPTPQTPLGLYLSYDELEDLLSRYPHPLNLAEDVKKEILAWTAGHIGAIKYLLESIKHVVRFY